MSAFSNKTVVELRAMAKARGAKGYSKLKKDELISLLEKKSESITKYLEKNKVPSVKSRIPSVKSKIPSTKSRIPSVKSRIPSVKSRVPSNKSALIITEIDTIILEPMPIPRQYGVCTFHHDLTRLDTVKKDGIDWSKKQTYSIATGKHIASGSYGDVYIGKNDKGEVAAVKVINLSKLRLNRFPVALIYNEIRIQSSLKHPHILQIIDVHESKQNIFITTDLAESGDLHDLINARMDISNKLFTISELGVILRQMIRSIKYCHDRDIVHRDIKPENFLIEGNVIKITNKGTCFKLADFGFATKCNDTQLLNDFPGSLLYMAPEIVDKVPYNGKKSDIWSLGVVAYIMATGFSPFGLEDDLDIFRIRQRSSIYRTKHGYDRLPLALKDIIGGCLAYVPKNRKTINYLLDRAKTLK